MCYFFEQIIRPIYLQHKVDTFEWQEFRNPEEKKISENDKIWKKDEKNWRKQEKIIQE